MPRYPKSGGITKLSDLPIDADKDWSGYGITNLGGIAAGMAIGHIAQHDGTKLVTLPPTAAGQVLTSQGPGHLVIWAPGGTYLFRYLPVSVDMAVVVAFFVPDEDVFFMPPVETELGIEDEINPGWFETLLPEVLTLLTAAIFTPDEAVATAAPVGTDLTYSKV